MLDYLPDDILLYIIEYNNFKNIMVIAKITKNNYNLIKERYNYLINRIIPNYSINIINAPLYITLKKNNRALTIPKNMFTFSKSSDIQKVFTEY